MPDYEKSKRIIQKPEPKEELEVKTTDIHFIVKLPPISKKNNSRIFRPNGMNHPIIVPSKQYVEYERNAMWFIPKDEMIDYPVNVKCLFYMPTKRKCDLVNMQEAILDVMVKAGLLKDDNYGIVQSMDGSRVLHDKENPRTEVYITKKECESDE